jgi:UDPglucose 6-dehydrogenase
MQIAVIGCGYVGLVTGGCFSAIGHQVICSDRDPELIQVLSGDQLPLYEPYLTGIIQQSRRAGQLAFTTDSAAATRAAGVIFLCVGVPQSDSGDPDFSALDAAARQIGAAADSPKLVVVRSTVPVQTGRQLKHLLAVYSRNRVGHFRVAANPQFLREGSAVDDFLHPDRILLGIEDAESEQLLREIYEPVVHRKFSCPVHSPSECPPRNPPELLVTNMQSAEFIKHATNSFLGVKISYANVLAELCERLEGNIQEVTQAIGLDPRIGPKLLDAGLGFGGSRLPKDLAAFRRLAERAGVEAGILREAERVNLSCVDSFLKKMERALWVLKDKHIGLLGLSYKPDTDDIRGSPAIELCKKLLAAGAQVRAFDPQAMAKAHAACPGIACGANAYEAAEHADAVAIATEWDQFRRLDWERIRSSMARPLVLDARNVLSPAHMKSLGFEYHSIGRVDP